MAKHHGLSHTITWKRWRQMMRRCYDLDRPESKLYIKRGITVCERWHKFMNFYKDMGICPKNKTLERIDNNLGYYKENCKWATMLEQTNNRSSNYRIKFAGLTMTVSEWSRFLHINSRFHQVFKSRMSRGYSLSEACVPLNTKWMRKDSNARLNRNSARKVA